MVALGFLWLQLKEERQQLKFRILAVLLLKKEIISLTQPKGLTQLTKTMVVKMSSCQRSSHLKSSHLKKRILLL